MARNLAVRKQAVPLPLSLAPPWTAVTEQGAIHPCLRKDLDSYVQKRQSDGRKAHSCTYMKIWERGRISLFILPNIFFFPTQCSALLFTLAVTILFPAHHPPQPSQYAFYNFWGVNSRTVTQTQIQPWQYPRPWVILWTKAFLQLIVRYFKDRFSGAR